MSSIDNNSSFDSYFHNDNNNIWKRFEKGYLKFMEKTNKIILQGITPGGIYKAIWCRDASYILKDWFLLTTGSGKCSPGPHRDQGYSCMYDARCCG